MTEAGRHEVTEWFGARVPADWFTAPIEVTADREEILVTGALPEGADPKAFRELTREERIGIASDAEHLFRTKVTWAVTVGDTLVRYTTVSVPVMTRLRIGERRVLDTLIAGGIARSRSEALAWCVRRVSADEADWLTDLRAATATVAEVRNRGPHV